MRTLEFDRTKGAIVQVLPKPRFHLSSAFATKEQQNQLLDEVARAAGLKNDADLARLLAVAPPVISKIRHNRLPFGATLAVAVTEVTDLTIADISAILAGRAST